MDSKILNSFPPKLIGIGFFVKALSIFDAPDPLGKTEQRFKALVNVWMRKIKFRIGRRQITGVKPSVTPKKHITVFVSYH